MASKGVTKSGDAFCMSCGAAVEPGSVRCESCYSQLDEEVKAFRCPRCETVLGLGTSQCPKCSMRFKVKSIRPSDNSEDERILSKLIEWGKTPTAEVSESVPEQAEGRSALTPEEVTAVSELIKRMSGLADLRAEVASSMGTSLSEARERISRMSDGDPDNLPLVDLESELASISQDMTRIDELLSQARNLAQEVSRTFSMPGPSGLVEGRTVSLTVPAQSDTHSATALDNLDEREEQIRKREEMVDRKIKAYALKKKQMDAVQVDLGSKLDASTPPSGPDPRVQELEDRMASLASKVQALHELVSPDGACGDVEPCLSSLEGHLKGLVVAQSELEQRVAQLKEGEDEVIALLKALDGLLGQLPSEVIDGFSKTDEFKLYERVLDRLRI